jgi:hypothetical protein
MASSLLCRVIGHKWTFNSVPTIDELKELPPPAPFTGASVRRVNNSSHCARCGEPNPQWPRMQQEAQDEN